jgi:hypothetical protein
MGDKTPKKTAISENYLAIKKLGNTGDSFNDIFTGVLLQSEKNSKNKQTKRKVDDQIHNENSRESNQAKITNSKVIKSPCVTTCLTNSHIECTGSYESRLGEFKIECHCSCHYNSDTHLNEKPTNNLEAQLGGHGG